MAKKLVLVYTETCGDVNDIRISVEGEPKKWIVGGCGCCGSPWSHDKEVLKAMVEAYNASVSGDDDGT